MNKTLIAGLAGALAVLVVVGAFLALDRTTLHWYAGDDARSSPPYGAVLDCTMPALSPADLHPAPNAPNQTPCGVLPSGMMLTCGSTVHPILVRDCPKIAVSMAGAVLDCYSPAENQADIDKWEPLPNVTPSKWWPQPCAGVPTGITLLCADNQPRPHLRDCDKIGAVTLYHPTPTVVADPCAPPTEMPPAERSGWEGFCHANHPPTVTP